MERTCRIEYFFGKELHYCSIKNFDVGILTDEPKNSLFQEKTEMTRKTTGGERPSGEKT